MIFTIIEILAVFIAMEPITYAAHRFVMHGIGWVLHGSHHQSTLRRIEANDAFPLIFASMTIAALALGTGSKNLAFIIPIGIGVTAYGLVYALIHDVYIHGRFFTVPRIGFLEPLRYSHQIHHLYNGEPYGMIFPYVPKKVRERADAVLAANRANGSSELLPWSNRRTTSKYVEI